MTWLDKICANALARGATLWWTGRVFVLVHEGGREEEIER